jgi:hypothetical protein
MDIVIGASVRCLKLIVLRNCTGLKFAGKGGEAEIDPDPADSTTVHFDDQRRKPDGRWRGNGVLQADTVRCSGYGALDYESHRFKRCMDSRGWRYDSTTEPTWSGGDY